MVNWIIIKNHNQGRKTWHSLTRLSTHLSKSVPAPGWSWPSWFWPSSPLPHQPFRDWNAKVKKEASSLRCWLFLLGLARKLSITRSISARIPHSLSISRKGIVEKLATFKVFGRTNRSLLKKERNFKKERSKSIIYWKNGQISIKSVRNQLFIEKMAKFQERTYGTDYLLK